MNVLAKIVLGLTLISSISLASGIPVVDAAANSQLLATYSKQVAEYAEQAKRWADTVAHYKSQIEAYTKELATKTGVRDAMNYYRQMKNIYSKLQATKTSLESLPTDLQKLTKLDNMAESLMGQYLTQDFCKTISDADKKGLCNASRRSTFKSKALIAERMEHIEKYQEMLTSLYSNMQNDKGDQEDMKQSIDYANALQMITSQMESEKMKIDLELQSLEYDAKIRKMQRKEKDVNALLGRGVKASAYKD